MGLLPFMRGGSQLLPGSRHHRHNEEPGRGTAEKPGGVPMAADVTAAPPLSGVGAGAALARLARRQGWGGQRQRELPADTSEPGILVRACAMRGLRRTTSH
jgi:hypothetical protein